MPVVLFAIRDAGLSEGGIGLVNYPMAKARGLHLRGITLTPSGALIAVHPYRVLIRWLVDCLSGAVQPVYVQATPTVSPAFRPLPLDVTILSTTLAVTPRDR